MRSVADSFGVALDFVSVPVEAFSSFPVADHVSHAAYYRLIGPEVLPATIQRLLYLDCDIVALGAVDDLWDFEMDGATMAAVRDFSNFDRFESLQIPRGAPYFNSGVLLIDCPLWRTENVTKRCMEYIAENPDKVVFWDQDALNHVVCGRWKQLDPVWNLQALAYLLPELDSLRRELEPQCRLMHYSSPSKPWEFVNEHPRKREYSRVLARSPWKGWTPSDATPIRRIKRFLFSILPSPLRAKASAWIKARQLR